MTDVAAWLRSLGLGQYEAASCDNAVDDADVLRQLTEADLEKLGVRLGDRKRILKAIAALDTGPKGKPGTEAAAERRQVSVLFCDLAGSTALSARLDPEDLREVMAAYHGAAADAVRKQGGHVAKLSGTVCWPSSAGHGRTRTTPSARCALGSPRARPRRAWGPQPGRWPPASASPLAP